MISVALYAQKNKSTEDKRFAGLDTAFARVIKDWKAAGFAVAVVEKNKVVYAKGFGYKDVENKLPATENTLFAIGSCTKAFTCAVMGQLEKDGKLDFDKPVRNYLPAVKFYNDELNDQVTLRDMMCHRTGLPRHDFSWYFFPSDSRDSFVQRLQYLEPAFALREKWYYNNFMYLLQGVVAEKLTGKSWEDNVREKFLQPLGMVNTNFSVKDMAKTTDFAYGYTVKKDSIIDKTDFYDINAFGPAGSINSSVKEMANWVMTWINDGKFNGKEILPAAFRQDAISSQMIMRGGAPSKDKPELYFGTYGLGWMLSSYYGHYRVEHGGNIDGFSASTCFFPSDSVGIIVLCNQDGSSVPSIVRNLVADRMLGLKYYDWQSDLYNPYAEGLKTAKSAEKTKSGNGSVPDTKPSHALKDYAGIYTNKGYGSFEVMLKNDSLFSIIGSHTWWLKHFHYDVFEPFDIKDGIDTADGSPLKLQFNLDINGNIDNATAQFEPTTKPIEFTRSAKPKEVTADDLKKYEGDYDISGVVIKIYVKETTLYMFVTGQPEYELVPVDKNRFNLKGLKGFTVQFNEDTNGKIIEALSIQPNGTFKAVKK